MPFDIEAEDRRTAIKQKLRKYFDGKIVRKDFDKEDKRGRKCACICIGVSSGTVLQFG